MTATYGDRTQEDHHLATAHLARLLEWDSEQTDLNRPRYDRLQALVIGTVTPLHPVEIYWTITEMFHLHQVFCRQYDVSGLARVAHGLRVLAGIGPGQLHLKLVWKLG